MAEQAIKVHLPARKQPPIESLSQAERTNIFVDFAIDPSLPIQQLEEYDGGLTEIIARDHLMARDSVREIMLRKIIDVDRALVMLAVDGLRDEGVSYPSSVDEAHFVTCVIDDFRINQRLGKSGGAPNRRRNLSAKYSDLVKSKRPASTRANVITVKFGYPVIGVTEDLKVRASSANEDMTVVGLALNALPQFLPFIKSADRMTMGLFSWNWPADQPLFPAGFSTSTMLFDTSPESLASVYDMLQAMYRAAFSQLANAATKPSYNKWLAVPIATQPHNTKQIKTVPLTDLEITMSKILSHNLAQYATRSGRVRAIEALGAGDIYYSALVLAVDNKNVVTKIDKWVAHAAAVKASVGARQAMLQDVYAAATVLMIAREKLSSSRIMEINTALSTHLYVTVADVKHTLTNTEARVIMAVYERKKAQARAIATNKCPHVAISKRFRLARTDEDVAAAFSELAEFYTDHNSDSVIKCSNCKFDLICPHVHEFTTMMLKHTPYDEMRAELNKYIETTALQQSYYCKLCAEVVIGADAHAQQTVADAQNKTLASIDDDLRTAMWSEAVFVLRALRFPAVINTKHFITTVIMIIYDYVFEIERLLTRSKANTAEDIKLKLQLFISIYVWAVCVHIVYSGDSKIKVEFKDMRIGQRMPKLTDYIKFAIVSVQKTRNSTIRRLPDVGLDFIKNKLIAAYKHVSGKQVIVTYADSPEETYNILATDPVYRFVHDVWAFERRRVDRRKNSKLLNMNKVLNYKVASIDKTMQDVFGAVKPLSAKAWPTNTISKLLHKRARGDLIDVAAAIPPDFIAELKYRSYASLLEFAKTLGSAVVYQGAVMRVDGREFDKERLVAAGLAFNAAAATKRWCLGAGMGDGSAAIAATYSDAALSGLFDEQGKLHKFDRFVYSLKPAVSFSSDELNARLAAGEDVPQDPIDRQCSVCSVFLSRVGDLDNDKIAAAVKFAADVGGFFRFYKNRCLKGGLHDWAGDTCKKCHIKTEMFAPATPTAIKFYKANRIAYDKARNTLVVSKPQHKPVAARDPTVGLEQDKWAGDYNVINRMASALKINVRAFRAIGAHEGLYYDELVSGAVDVAALEVSLSRLAIVDNANQRFFTEYNSMRFFHRILRPSPTLTKLFVTAKVPTHKLPLVDFVDINDKYNERAAYMRSQANGLARAVEFALEFLAARLLKVLAVADAAAEPEVKALGYAFARSFVTNLLKSEELKTKHGLVNWALFKPETDEVASDAGPTEDNKLDDEETKDPFEATLDIDYDIDSDDFDNDLTTDD